MSEIIEFKFENKASNDMVTAVKDCIYSFAGRVSVAEALGVIEIVKQDLHNELLRTK